jgi:cobalt-zinc-cadmium resistance protein CzcA
LTGQPFLQVRVDPQAIARYGVSVRNVLNVVEALGTRGWARCAKASGASRWWCGCPTGSAPIPTRWPRRSFRPPSGRCCRLNQVATITLRWKARPPSTASGAGGASRVQCNVRGRDVAGFVAEAGRRSPGQLKLPEGYTLEWGGQFENMERANRRLLFVVPMALGLIFVLLYFSLRSMREVLIVATGIPLGAVGGVLALCGCATCRSRSAPAIGFIALSGVAILNGLVLVTFIKQRLDAGTPLEEAVREGCLVRLRPVLMTALVAAVGFIPMAVNVGVGGEVQRPLATVVIGGIVTNTLLTLLVLPALYTMFKGKKAAEVEVVQPTLR